jgi:hypothetical protein
VASAEFQRAAFLSASARKETEMPFGLDLKSIVVGMLLAYFVLPMVMGFFNRPTAQPRAAA